MMITDYNSKKVSDKEQIRVTVKLERNKMWAMST